MSKKSPVAKKARAERLRHRGSSTAAHVRDLERRHAELDRLSAAGAFDAPADRDLEPGEAQVMCYMTLEHKVWLVIVILNGEVRILPVEKYTGPDDLCTKVAEYIRRKGGTKMELVEQLSPGTTMKSPRMCTRVLPMHRGKWQGTRRSCNQYLGLALRGLD